MIIVSSGFLPKSQASVRTMAIQLRIAHFFDPNNGSDILIWHHGFGMR
jgi:hypothetical protein